MMSTSFLSKIILIIVLFGCDYKMNDFPNGAANEGLFVWIVRNNKDKFKKSRKKMCTFVQFVLKSK